MCFWILMFTYNNFEKKNSFARENELLVRKLGDLLALWSSYLCIVKCAKETSLILCVFFKEKTVETNLFK